MTHVAFVCVSAWLWRREALRHYKLQFWSQRRRKAARLQGPAETQPDRDVKTFSTRRRFIALYSFWLVSQAEPSQWWPFECPELGSSQTVFFFLFFLKSSFSLTEQPVSQTLQEETAAFLLLDFLSESPGCSLHVSQPPTVRTCWSCWEGVFCFFPLSHGQ